MSYHFIGIAGAGMSALATILKEQGHHVTGSDRILNNIDVANINPDQIIVKSAAIPESNVELLKAKELNLEILTYPEMLGIISKQFKTIAVSGCHGKTTTSSLITHLLKNTIGTNYLVGDGTGGTDKNSDLFVIEACEYRRHFLKYDPTFTIITNIDLDHVDYYQDLDDIIDAYQSLVDNTKETIIAYGDDPYVKRLKFKEVLLYGFEDTNDIVCKNLVQTKEGSSFDIYIKDEYYDNFFIPHPGKHLVLNTASAIALCHLLDIDVAKVKELLKTAPRAARRFNETVIGENIIIDDYAHHAPEIKYTIEAARQKYPDKPVIAVFWPHTYSRTKMFYKEIAKALKLADTTYIFDIFPARERKEDYQGVTSDLIIKELADSKKIDFDTLNKLLDHKNSVIIFMSPRDTNEYLEKYIEMLK